MDEKLKREAEEAERQRAHEALQPHRATEADLAEVMEVNAVDDYVAATGEFPPSGDNIAGPDVVDDPLLVDAPLVNDPVGIAGTPAERTRGGGRPTDASARLAADRPLRRRPAR